MFNKNKKGKLTNNKNKYFLLFVIFVLISIILITIGYSSFESTLTVSNLKVDVRPDKNVRITSTSISSKNNNANISNFNYGTDIIYSDYYLPNQDSEVTYLVQVKNFGNVEVGIKEFILSDNYKDVLKVETTEYTEGSMIKDNQETCIHNVDGCKLDIIKTFYLTIKYQENAYNNTTERNFSNVTINFNFVQMYRITYEVLDNGDYPEAVFDGDNLSVNFPSNPSNLIITGSDNYTYSNGDLTINNIKNDIIIEDPMVHNIEYNITYVGLDTSSTSEYPTTVKRGDSFEIKYSKIYSVEVSGTTNYINDTQNGILTVNNASNDIEITFTQIYDVDYAIEVDENANTVTLSLDETRVNSTQGTEITTLFSSGNKMTGVNLTNKKITSITVEIDYVGPGKGSNSSFNCILNAIDNVDTSNNVVNRSNSVTLSKAQTTKATKTITFDGLNLSPDSTFDITNTIIAAGKDGFKIFRFDIVVNLEEITN